MNPTPESPFPTKEQEFLLKAALYKNEEALDAWNIWKQTADFDGYMDQGSFRLLPLLYKNLLEHKVKDPLMNKLKGVYRQAWYKNHKLLYDAANVILFLQKSGIQILLLKGAALGKLYYKDTGVRPMADIDILVPFSKARITIDILKNSGWEPEFEAYIEYNLHYGRSMQFTDDAGFELDLHWHPFFESHRDNTEKYFWDEAIQLKIGDVSTLSLCPADMLLHTFIHGINWNKEPPIRWIADAFFIINAEDLLIDWERFILQVKKYKVVLQTREAMNYLIKKFNVAVPEEVMNELSQIKITLAEKLVFRESQKDPDNFHDSFFIKLYKLFVIYLQQSDKTNIFFHIIGFISYLRFRTKGKDYFRILVYYFTKGFRKDIKL